MSASSVQGNRLTLADKFSRLGRRMRDPEWRRYAKLVFAGKFAGIVLVLLIIAVVSGVFFAHAYAADPEVKAADVVNPVNTAWTLVAAFLVFGMQVGFTMLEAGFCRSRETVNTYWLNAWSIPASAAFCSMPSASHSCLVTETGLLATTGSSCKTRPRRTKLQASPSWPFGFSNLLLRTPARRSLLAR